MRKPGAKPVRNKRPDRCRNRKAVEHIFREGIYLRVSVGSSIMRIEVRVSTSVSPYELV